ncbi:MAG: YiiX/YebB-like N1pC/P60 family cysteine hydrolase [Beijerinckiaceae bacterium]
MSKFEPVTTNGAERLRGSIQPGDVLLVEGNSRVSSAIKYLTQSTWSHAALCVGPMAGRQEPDGEPHVLVEAELGMGVISSPLSRHQNAHTRICRPAAMESDDLKKILEFATAKIGELYDVKNVVDLLRYLMPHPPVPVRFRRRLLALGSGDPTRFICSTLIAQAFHVVQYPILPRVEVIRKEGAEREAEMLLEEIHHIRHFSLYTPRDFDISPFFSVVKPTFEGGFDYRRMKWANRDELVR